MAAQPLQTYGDVITIRHFPAIVVEYLNGMLEAAMGSGMAM